MNSRVVLSACFFLSLSSVIATSGTVIDDFIGVWANRDEGCKPANDGGRRFYMIIDHGTFAELHWSGCDEAKIWLAGNILRVSAICEYKGDGESGREVYIREFEKSGEKTIRNKDSGEEYVLCSKDIEWLNEQ